MLKCSKCLGFDSEFIFDITMKTSLEDCSHCPNCWDTTTAIIHFIKTPRKKTKLTTKPLQHFPALPELSSCSLTGHMREHQNDLSADEDDINSIQAPRLEAVHLEYAEFLPVTSLFDHNHYSILQQWWVREPQASVGIVLIKRIRFLQAPAVHCGLVLRGSDQLTVSSYCIPRCLVGEAWPGQPVTGETDRPRKRRSMEGSRGFRRLTGQKAEPPWGVKLTLLGSGQDGWRTGSSW